MTSTSATLSTTPTKRRKTGPNQYDLGGIPSEAKLDDGGETLMKRTAAQLKQYCTQNGIPFKSNSTKKALVSLIQASARTEPTSEQGTDSISPIKSSNPEGPSSEPIKMDDQSLSDAKHDMGEPEKPKPVHPAASSLAERGGKEDCGSFTKPEDGPKTEAGVPVIPWQEKAEDPAGAMATSTGGLDLEQSKEKQQEEQQRLNELRPSADVNLTATSPAMPEKVEQHEKLTTDGGIPRTLSHHENAGLQQPARTGDQDEPSSALREFKHTADKDKLLQLKQDPSPQTTAEEKEALSSKRENVLENPDEKDAREVPKGEVHMQDVEKLIKKQGQEHNADILGEEIRAQKDSGADLIVAGD